MLRARALGSVDGMDLEPLGPGLWTAEGPTAIDLAVVPYPTRMTIARLRGGGLWVSSPVPTSADDLDAIRALGPVEHLVSATPRHQWRLESWHVLFPDAKLWACAQGPATLGGRKLPATVLRRGSRTPWNGDLEHAVYPGLGFEEAVFLHRDSGTLLVEDILQSHDALPGRPGVRALVRAGGVERPGGVPRDIRAITRRKLARQWLDEVLSWDFDRLVMAHGPVIRAGAKAYVEQSFGWLTG